MPEEIPTKNTRFDSFEIEHDFPNIGKHSMLVNACRIYLKPNRTKLIILTIRDTSEREESNQFRTKITELENKLKNPASLISIGSKNVKNYMSNDARVFIGCSALLVLVFVMDILFRWTVGGVLYLFVILLSLRFSRNRDVYFFAVLTSFLLVVSWQISPSIEKIWHVSIALIWVTAILGLHYKKIQSIKSALADIVDSSFDAIIGKTLTNIVLSWNEAAENLYGYNKEEMVGQSTDCLIHEGGDEDELRLFEAVKEGKAIEHYHTVRKHKDGHLIQVSLTLSPIKDPSGSVVGISSFARDITDRIIVEKRLKELNEVITLERNKIRMVLNIEEHLNTIFDLNKLIDFVVDKITEVLDAKKCSLILVDYDTRELCIKGHKGIDHKFIQEGALQTRGSVAEMIIREGKPVLVTDIESDTRFSRQKRPSYQTKSFISAPIKLGANTMGFVNVADKNSQEGDVFSELDLKILRMILRQVAVAMENAKLYRELTHLAITDPLTNIYNFRYFTQTLDHEIIRLKRHPSRPLCLLMIDVDDFKAYNDEFGHLEGDTCLRVISTVLRKNIREVDIVCRYAGDEFALILPEIDIPEALILSERIKSALATLSLKREITVSIGIAKCMTPNMDRYELIKRADLALFDAKKAGKNAVHSAG